MIALSEQSRSLMRGNPLASLAQSFRFGAESLQFHGLPVILPDNPSLVTVRSNWPTGSGIWYTDKNAFKDKEMPPIIFPEMGRCSNIIVGKGDKNILFGHLSDNTLDYGEGGIKKVVEELRKVLGENVQLDLYRLRFPFGEQNEPQFINDLQKSLGDVPKIKIHHILLLSREEEKEIDAAYTHGRLTRVFNYHPGRSIDLSKSIGHPVSISSDG